MVKHLCLLVCLKFDGFNISSGKNGLNILEKVFCAYKSKCYLTVVFVYVPSAITIKIATNKMGIECGF